MEQTDVLWFRDLNAIEELREWLQTQQNRLITIALGSREEKCITEPWNNALTPPFQEYGRRNSNE